MADQQHSRELSCRVAQCCKEIFGRKECREVTKEVHKVWYDYVKSEDFYRRDFIGSCGQGITYKCGDMKEVFVLLDYVVVEAWDDLESSDRFKCRLRAETENCHPGYCLLRQLPTRYLNENVYEEVGPNCTYLSSEKFLEMCVLKSREGTFQKPPYAVNRGYHFLYCLPMKKWPRLARSFEDDYLRSWPDESTVSEMKAAGVVFAPVGHPMSRYEKSTWQMSFRCAETVLTRAFPETIMTLFQILRLMFKEGLTSTSAKKAVNSRVIRHLLFWKLSADFSNILIDTFIHDYFVASLLTLSEWVEASLAPNFFMPHLNLFEDERVLTADVRSAIRNVILSAVKEGMKYILRFRFFVTIKLFIVTGMFTEERRTEERTIYLKERALFSNISAFSYSVFSWQSCLQTLENIKSALGEHDLSEMGRCTLLVTYKYISTCAGIKLYNAITQGQRNKSRFLIYSLSRRLLKKGIGSDVTSGKLNLASFLFLTGQYNKCCLLTESVQSTLLPFTIYVKRCGGHVRKSERERQYQYIMGTSTIPLHIKMRRAAVADVEIYKESPVCPEELLLEITLVEGPPYVFSVPFYAYLYLLRYLACRACGDVEKRNQTFADLKTLVLDDEHRGEGHLTYNICGLCAEMENDLNFAMKMYSAGYFAANSQSVPSSRNSSLFRTTLLLKKALRY